MSASSNSEPNNNHHNRREQILKLFGKTAGFLDRVCCMSSYQEAQVCGESQNEKNIVEYNDDDTNSSVVWLSDVNEYTPREFSGDKKRRPIILGGASSSMTTRANHNVSNQFNNLSHYRLHLQQQQQEQLRNSPRFPDDFPYYCDFERRDRGASTELNTTVNTSTTARHYPSCSSPDRSSIITATTVTMNTRSPSVVSDVVSDAVSDAFSSSTVVTHNTQQPSCWKSPARTKTEKQLLLPVVTPSQSSQSEEPVQALDRSSQSAPVVGVSSFTNAYSNDEHDEDNDSRENMECISPSFIQQRRTHSKRPREHVARCWSMEVSRDTEKTIRQIQKESLEQLEYLSKTEGYEC